MVEEKEEEIIQPLDTIYCELPNARPCHSSGGYSPASHRGGQGPIPDQVMWDLWWTKWHRGRFSPSTSVSPDNSHSTDCSTLIIYHYHPGLVQ
jgi:hypothetical protein